MPRRHETHAALDETVELHLLDDIAEAMPCERGEDLSIAPDIPQSLIDVEEVHAAASPALGARA